MNKKEIQKLKKKLEEEKKEIIETLKKLENELEEVKSSVPSEQIEQAAYTENLKYLNTQIDRDKKKLEAINETIKRIDKNEFGRCVKCGVKIKDDRLKTLPTTLYCRKCAVLLK
ncbi:MAG TPA: TraR/DksA C4-type zinc finger protein [bacterium]|nr:TraR/DksA C4-type zinc finger protein [bacterium]HPQ18255.1 TraR/DksA C4-type zinc finger protein [bacterium]